MIKGTTQYENTKLAWENYAGWTKDIDTKSKRSSGMAGARAAQRGVKRGSAAWEAIQADIEKDRVSEMEEITGGATADYLKRQQRSHASSIGMGRSKLGSELHDLRRTSTVDQGGYATKEEYLAGGGTQSYGPGMGDNWGRRDKSPHIKGPDYVDNTIEIGRMTDKLQKLDEQYEVATGDMDEYYVSLFGEFEPEIDVKEEAIDEARKATTGGSTSVLAMGVGFDDEEDKKANIWI